MKLVKKVLSIVLGVLLTFSFVSCSSLDWRDAIVVTTKGLSNYQKYQNDSGVNVYQINIHLIPENMLSEYSYLNGDYYYHIDPRLHIQESPAVSILYLKYSDEVYSEAKEYMLENTDYTEEIHYTYNGYEFYENLTMPKAFGHLDQYGNNKYSYNWFNMISYNDQNNTLVFLGFCHYRKNYLKEMVQTQGWGAVLKEYFSYYDFDA
jgi:hypothetical protein